MSTKQRFAEWLGEELNDSADMYVDDIRPMSMSNEELEQCWREWRHDRDEQVEGGVIRCYTRVQGEFGGQRKDVWIATIDGERLAYAR